MIKQRKDKSKTMLGILRNRFSIQLAENQENLPIGQHRPHYLAAANLKVVLTASGQLLKSAAFCPFFL
jgi:hypothetical protein